ncbi:MAG: hypothetical protein ABI747_01755, partial [Candidatus Moraniibacteriota bacterium]
PGAKNLPDPQRQMTQRLWKNTLSVMLGVYFFSLLYVVLLDKEFTLGTLVKSVAGASSIALALSLSLSTSGYYFDVFDGKVVYRKYFGLTGYFLALFYSSLLFLLEPEFYFFGFLQNFWTPDIFLGTLSLSILTVMAVISNDGATRFLGPLRWRSLLRLGFLAYFLLVVRAIILEGDLWWMWFEHPDSLPRVRLVLSLIALVILFFRASMIFSKKREEKPRVTTPLSA